MSPTGLHINKPLVVTIIGVILTLGVVYKYSDTLGLTESKSIKLEAGIMAGTGTGSAVKLPEFSIPDDVLTNAKSVKVVESTVEVPFKDKKIKIFLRKPETDGNKLSVLLLHGQAFTSNNWNEIGTIQLLGVSGYKVIAVDLPGYGKSDSNRIASENKGEFLGELIKTLKLELPVIVSPSMSGSFALPYLFGGDVSNRASGYVAIAPVDTDKYKDKYPSSKIKTLVIRGSKDETLGITSEENLKNIPNNAIYIIPNAGHACYMNNTSYFHNILYGFLKTLSK